MGGSDASTADLKSLHHMRQVRSREFRSISGTRVDSLLVPILLSEVRKQVLLRRTEDIDASGPILTFASRFSSHLCEC